MSPEQQPIPPGQPTGPGNKLNVADIYPSANSSSDSNSTQSSSLNQGVPQPHIEPAKPEKPKKTKDGLKSALSTIALFLLAPIIALSLTAYAFQSYQVDGQSMETTLQNNDRLIVNKIPRTISRVTGHPFIPDRGTIVVFNGGGLFDSTAIQEKQLIKRVIALPGEDIEVKDGKITVYNKEHPNGFDPDRAGIYTISAKSTPQDVARRTLGPAEIFVCGDNRANSEDSRYFGPINADRLVGNLTFRIYPISKAEKF